jgi:hypothetical protein
MDDHERREFSEFAEVQEYFFRFLSVDPPITEDATVVLRGGPDDGLTITTPGRHSEIITLTAANEIAHYKRRGEEYTFSHMRRTSK